MSSEEVRQTSVRSFEALLRQLRKETCDSQHGTAIQSKTVSRGDESYAPAVEKVTDFECSLCA